MSPNLALPSRRALRGLLALLLMACLPRSAAALQNFDGVSAPALPAGWTRETLSNGAAVAGPLWQTVTDHTHSAPNAAWVYSDLWLGRMSLVSPTFTPQAGQRLRFRHRYRMDTDGASGLRDGGVLEISVNGGAFTDLIAAGGQFPAGGYALPITASSNPLFGRMAWGGQQTSFVETQVQFPAAAVGQPLRLRWSVGTDHIGTASDSGWWIDSIELFAVATFPPQENFDLASGGALPLGWSTQSSGAGADWSTVTTASDSAPNAAFAPNATNTSDKALVSPSFTPVANQVLRFRHRYDLWASFEGAVLEYSRNGGAWQDITDGGSFRAGGYVGSVFPGAFNPLEHRSAWVDDSNGFIETLVRLPDANVGQSTRLRWRLGTDAFAGAASGWWVDSISLEAPRTVTANASGPGQISPSGTSSIEYAQSTSFTLTPNAGSYLASIVSSCGGHLTGVDGFRTGEVRADCTVTANFAAGAAGFPDTEDFDDVAAPALPAGWFTQTVGAGPAWVTSAQFADSAPNQATVPITAGTDRSLISPEFTVDAAHVLSFRHSYQGFALNATGYDGGVLEIALGGNGFVDILSAGGSFITEGYTAGRTMTHSSALAGRAAWTGNSNGYVTTRVRMPPAAAGQRARLRWRMAGVSGPHSGFGWRVDSIALSTPGPVTVTPSVVGQGSIVPADPVQLTYGDSADFDFAAAAHHHFDRIEGDCGATLLDGDTVRTAPVVADCTLELHFAADPPDFPNTEDFDNDTPGELPWGWSTQSSGAGADWTTVDDSADSAPHAAFAAAPNAASDKALVSPDFVPLAGQVLRFRHRHQLAEFPQSIVATAGAVLEMSIDGAGFEPIESLGGVFLAGGYRHFVFVSSGNHALQGRLVWGGDSGGFVETEVRLPPQAVGLPSRLRWRVASANDVFGSDGGWWIDSIQLHEPAARTVTPAAQGPGQIQPAAPVGVDYGDTASLQLAPDFGAHLVGVDSACGGSLTAVDTFVTARVRADCGVSANFSAETPRFPIEEDFDLVTAPALPLGWLALSDDGSAGWRVDTLEAQSPPHLARVPLALSRNDESLVAPLFEQFPGDILRFRQRLELPVIDATQAVAGGVLEIAVGTQFVDIVSAGGEFLAGGYTHTMFAGSHPLSGRPVWSGRSGAFFETVVRLPPDADAQNVRLRWRMGSETIGFAGPDRGWFIDDVRLELPQSHVVTAAVVGAGEIAPNAPVSVAYGETATFDLDPDVGHAVTQVDSDCGGALTGPRQFRTGPVFDDCNLVVHFGASDAPEVALSVGIDDARERVAPGDAVEYTVTVRNDSDDEVENIALATTLAPAGALLDAAWQCSVPAGGACAPAQGAGQVATTLTIPANAQATILLEAQVGNFTAPVEVTAALTVPDDYIDTDAADNTATDTDLDARPPVFGNGFEG